MDGHDWTHDPLDHDAGHDPLEPPDLDDQHSLQHGSELEPDWPDGHDHDHHHDLDHDVPADHPAFEDAAHADEALPAEQIYLEPEAGELEPPVLEVSVTPADGLDWVDPQLLGHTELPLEPYAAPQELLESLHHAAGTDAGDWDAMAASEDPAVRALAQFWRPEQP